MPGRDRLLTLFSAIRSPPLISASCFVLFLFDNEKSLAPDRRPPPPSTAHSQAETVYPDPSPANSPGSNMDSNPVSESNFPKVIGKTGDPNGTRNTGVSMDDVKFSAAVQTTPSVNGAEMENLK